MTSTTSASSCPFVWTGEVWQFMGFPAYGHGPFEKIGIPATVPLLAGFAVVCGAEVIAGRLLWRGSGKKLSLALLPFEIAYWIGFALPFGPVLGVGRVIAAGFAPSLGARPR